MTQASQNTDIENLWQVIEKTLNSQDYKKFFENKFSGISYYYQKFLNSDLPVKSYKETVISIDKKIKISDYDKKAASFLEELKDYFIKNLSNFVIGSFIHGSIATNDYTDFSDIDAGMIVKDEVMLNPGLLKELQKKLKLALKIILKFDNLQHHGFFIIPEGILNYYPEEYLPIEVLKYARALNEPLKLKIKTHRSTEKAKKNFLRMAKFFADGSFKKTKNLYEVKHILSQFMLLPTLYLQAKGVYVYKKYSFELVKKEFPDDWWVMEEVSKIREDWIRPKSKIFNTLVDILPNPWMASLIYRKMDWKIPEWLFKRLETNLYNEMGKFAKEMVNKIHI